MKLMFYLIVTIYPLVAVEHCIVTLAHGVLFQKAETKSSSVTLQECYKRSCVSGPCCCACGGQATCRPNGLHYQTAPPPRLCAQPQATADGHLGSVAFPDPTI